MSVKSKLLEEVNRKAQKIKEKKKQAANNKTIEAYVFDFFREIESIDKMPLPPDDKFAMVVQVHYALRQKIRTVDIKANVEPVHNGEGRIQGIRILWSKTYQTTNLCDPELYIDVSQMLLSELT